MSARIDRIRADVFDGLHRVAYDHRHGSDEALLYFHGLGGSRTDFQGAWSVSDWERYALVAFDAPGCGDTRGHRPGARLEVDDIVHAAEAVVAHLGLSDLTVIGHSLGGLAALLFALRHPSLVRRFVSVEGNLGPEDCSIYSRRLAEAHAEGRGVDVLEGLLEALATSDRIGFADAGRVFRRNVQDGAALDYSASLVRYCDNEPLRDAYLELPVPTLYVHGDANCGSGHIPVFTEAGARIASIERSDHFPAHSNPEGFHGALRDFIASTPT